MVFFCVSLSYSIFSMSFVIVSQVFCDEFLENFVISFEILLQIKLPVASALF